MTYKNYPFIVIEGLDGVGKSTAVQGVADMLGGRVCSSPSENMKALKHIFHEADVGLRTQYYELCNAEFSSSLPTLLSHSTIICDRYVASTTAADLAFGSIDSIDFTQRLEDFKWPPNCEVPDLTIHLTLDEDVRKSRIVQRGEGKDRFEAAIEKETFRNRHTTVYSYLSDIDLDITGMSPHEVVYSILEIIALSGLFPKMEALT